MNHAMADTTVLVVDDVIVNCRLMERLLASAGCERVLLAQSGPEALAAMGADAAGSGPAIDLVLLDVVMPGMDGLEVTRRVRAQQDQRDVPIIMVTEKATPEDLQAGFQAGAMDYIAKPVKKVELLARAGAALALKREMDLRRKREEELRAAKEELEEANARLSALSVTDPLTGLANRRRLSEFLAEEFVRARRDRTPVSVVMADIDNFKAYNDTYGHQQGDRAIQDVATIMAGSVRRPGDLAARYGGEEMAAVLAATPFEGALTVAENMRAGVAGLLLEHKGSELTDHLTISLGVATAASVEDVEPEALVGLADEALYRAKEEGRNRVCAHEGDARDARAA